MTSRARPWGWTLAMLGAICVAIVPAQTSRVSPAAGLPATADAVIKEMAVAAGVIFAGQVMAVRMPATFAGVVEVDLRVDQAVSGPTTGAIYTLREWAGLWNANGSGSGGGRYRVGQRLLLFLYAPDANGLSSPVRGLTGAIPLRGGGAAPGPDDTTDAAAQWMVDLRWVEAQAVRSDGVLTIPVRGPVSPRPISPRPVSDLAEGNAADDPVRLGMEPVASMRRQLPEPSPRAAVPPQAQPLAQILALCREAIGQSAMRRTDESR